MVSKVPSVCVIEVGREPKPEFHVYARTNRVHLGSFGEAVAARTFADGFDLGVQFAKHQAEKGAK